MGPARRFPGPNLADSRVGETAEDRICTIWIQIQRPPNAGHLRAGTSARPKNASALPFALKVLIVDDDTDFANLTRMSLEPHGVQCHLAASGEQAALLLEEQSGFDLILLDIELPGVSGWDLLTNLREAGEETPVLFVSGLQAVEKRVRGLRMGADDYLTKPVDHGELFARMEAVLRRRAAMPQMHFGDLRLDLAQRRAYRGDRALHLSPKEFDLLLALTRGRGEVLSRAQLLEQVWDMNFDPGTNLLDVHIGRLRRKVDRKSSGLIQTVRGQGYRLQMASPATENQPS